MRKRLSAGLVAAGMIILAAPAFAQQEPAQMQDRATDGARTERSERPRLSADDRAALVDARIAALRAGLKLNAEQEKNWPPVEAAIRDLAKERAQRFAELRERRDARERPDAIQRMRNAADAMNARAAGLKRLADASEPLYRSLDDGQKRRLQVLSRQAMRQHHPGLRRQ